VSEDKQWHLDKRVNISIILAVAAQTAAGIWWASAINTRVERLEQDKAVALVPPTMTDRMSRVEAFIDTIRSDISEIKGDVKALVRRSSDVRQ